MPRVLTWNEVVTAARQQRLAHLDVRAVEVAVLAADDALRAAESRAESATGEDTAMPPIAAPVPVGRVRRAVKRVDDAE